MSTQAIKRANDAQDGGLAVQNSPSTSVPTKKARTSTSSNSSAGSESLQRALSLRPAEIQTLGAEEARIYLGEIQSAYVQLYAYAQQVASKQASTSTASAGAEAWTQEKIIDKANKLSSTVAREIKKQMKWQPSCKKGTTKWSYVSIVPNEAVFREMFNMKNTTKKLPKTSKMSLSDFEDIFGSITASIRYGSLVLTGSHVNITWKPEDNEFRVSGTYGVWGSNSKDQL